MSMRQFVSSLIDWACVAGFIGAQVLVATTDWADLLAF